MYRDRQVTVSVRVYHRLVLCDELFWLLSISLSHTLRRGTYVFRCNTLRPWLWIAMSLLCDCQGPDQVAAKSAPIYPIDKWRTSTALWFDEGLLTDRSGICTRDPTLYIREEYVETELDNAYQLPLMFAPAVSSLTIHLPQPKRLRIHPAVSEPIQPTPEYTICSCQVSHERRETNHTPVRHYQTTSQFNHNRLCNYRHARTGSLASKTRTVTTLSASL